jgi:xylose isomerase
MAQAPQFGTIHIRPEFPMSTEINKMYTPIFSDVPKIKYEGQQSRNPLAFKHYNTGQKVAGRSMRDHLRFAVCYWRPFRNQLSDPFGAPMALRPWDDGSNSVANA